MKKIVLLLSALVLLSCEKEDNYIEPKNKISACGYDDPLNQLQWLNEMANKALIDNSGNYQGSIWIVSLTEADCIVTDMSLGSGGVYHYYFDCSGKPFSDEDGLKGIENLLKDSNMIFSTVHQK